MKTLEFVVSQVGDGKIIFLVYVYGAYTKEERHKAYLNFVDECIDKYGDLDFYESNMSPIYE